eukprot:Skav219897  [mRNA]  locus=scaffold841:182067:184126:+ [translate_table: standard]
MSTQKFRAFLDSMGISTEDVGVLFKLLDADNSGLVELEEFVSGCMNLHGTAKSPWELNSAAKRRDDCCGGG